jgi:transposase
MFKQPMIQTVKQLREAGRSLREISQLLSMSRNTVRQLLKKKDNDSKQGQITAQHESSVPLIQELLKECGGNLVRVHERLTQDHQLPLAYSTLTYLVRKYQLKTSTTPQRIGEYDFKPGEEMQHDTSPHTVIIGGKRIKAQCASLVLAFSRQLFIQYYPCFTRFEAKLFLQEALSFMQGSCRRCVIDNTSVILGAGAGSQAVMAPEMQFFSRFFGFEFMAHAVNRPQRKGRCERDFNYAETNFLAGRKFQDWEDLNRQARHWCETVANQKIKRSLGMSPQTAYIQEKRFLLPLPETLLPIYKHEKRVVDTQGYVNLETNRYSTPESHIGHEMDVYQYLDKIEIYYHHRLITSHARIIGSRNQRSIIKGHHRHLYRRENQQASCAAEKQLMGCSAILDGYIQQLKSHVRGRGVWSFKRLLYLKQLYPWEAFLMAIEQAKQYGLYDLTRLEKMIIRCVAGDFFNL